LLFALQHTAFGTCPWHIQPWVYHNQGPFQTHAGLKDHLGNNRVTFMGTDLGGTIDIAQTTNYYHYGLVMNQGGNTKPTNQKNKYLYNGKELQDDKMTAEALNFYDYGARFYDPQIGRWTTLDPLAEKNRRWSPYAYCYNNPMKFIDPDGRNAIYSKDKNGNIVITADVYVSGADADQLKNIRDNINSTWKTTTYTGKDGKKHSISFNIKLSSQYNWNKMSKEDKEVAKDKSNFVTMVNTPGYRSNVVGGVKGLWATDAKNSVYAHEMGHFLGLADRYSNMCG
jgi:RHS repeat-associated protein